MKNILVTGGCGFIGANFISYLFNDANFKGNVINADKLTYAGNPDNLKEVEKNFNNQYIFIKADICDQKKISDIFDEYEIDTVCHFAAESHVDRSILNPFDFINTNVIGSFVLLEEARKRIDKIKLFHHISTDEVFGSLGETGLFTENTPYKPNSPYSASKASSDHFVRAYFKTYGLPVTISNCSNNYGPYQFPEKLIPLMILNACEDKNLPVYGDGLNVRDWLYVKDHCDAIWTIMTKGKIGQTYNVGGNNEIKNIDIVENICDILDEINGKKGQNIKKKLIKFIKDRPGHDRRYAIDALKIKNELSWSPKESFETGIKKTINWYLNNSDWIKRVKSGDYKTWINEQYS